MTKLNSASRSDNSKHTFKLFGLPKLPNKAMVILVPLFLSGIMSGVVALISILRSVGMTEGMATLWFSSWTLSWAIAFPTVLVVLPLARRLALALVKPAT